MYTYGHTFKINVAVVVDVDWICLLFSSLCNRVSLEVYFQLYFRKTGLVHSASRDLSYRHKE